MEADIDTAIEQMRREQSSRSCNRDVGDDGVCNLELGHAGEHSMRDLKQFLSEEALTALAKEVLAPTPLGDVAALLKEAMKMNMAPRHGPLGTGGYPFTERELTVNDKLAEALNIINALRGDGQ